MMSTLKKYIVLSISILVIAIVLLFAVGKISTAILDKANDTYLIKYQNAEEGYSSPWYKDGLHIVDEGFINEMGRLRDSDKRVISIGSSVSRIGFMPDMKSLPNGYDYYFLVCGNGCHISDKIFVDMLNLEGYLNKASIIKYEISFSTFRDTPMTIAESSIEKWGKYSIKDGALVKNSDILLPLYWLNVELLKPQNVGEYLFTENNFCNNYFDYDAVAATCYMDDDMKASVKEDILRIKAASNVLVELSALPKGLANTDYGKTLNDYIDNELLPFLDAEGIEYLDHRDSFEESEFADGVHLSYNAGRRYTQMLNEEMTDYIERMQ